MKSKQIDLKKIASKWQKKWELQKIFEVNPSKKEKFFLNFPYPYINAYPHIGHLYTLMRVEALARFKRLQGFNVLFPQGWHATGSPIENAAKRVKEREQKQVKIMHDMGFKDSELKAFENPKHWLDFFAPEFKKDWKSMGVSIDWRREFYTTSLNPHYDKFIGWQFRKLKEKGYCIKGSFPVVWCPKCNGAVGDHARSEGEGETTQEFCLFKFALKDGRKIITATLRPDTVFGITNVYVNPEVSYAEIKTKNEQWIVGEETIEKLKNQNFSLQRTGSVKGIDLIGQKVESFGGRKIPVLPATFLDSNYGTGMVHSVPSDSADDLIALQDLQKNDRIIQKYNLNLEEIKSIKPIEIFHTPEIGGNSAQHLLDKYHVKSQHEREKLEKIKKELYKLTFTKSTLGHLYKKGFSKNLEGVKISEAQEIIKKELLKANIIELFYDLTGRVVCRCLTPSTVKIVADQWFINYADSEWKKITHKCLDNLRLYPEKARSQFEYVIDWLHAWACTREEGLGTRLPWDEKWVIESLSDSTIYLAYYTISHLIKKIPANKVNDELFNYIFLGKGKNPILDKKEVVEEMKKNFEYFYPVDFRNSGKDLIQNHLAFFLFNHAAIFPKDKWPKGIGVNGWVVIDGEKMSKSLGNMIPLRVMVDKFSADVSRITMLSGGEGVDDPNWETEFANSMVGKLGSLFNFCNEFYDKGRIDTKPIDYWFESELNKIIKEATTLMEETMFRSAIQQIYFSLQSTIRWYLRRCNNNPNKKLMNKAIEAQLIMLTPFTPHICEETWESIGKKDFISLQKWPEYENSKIKPELNTSENMIQTVINDIKKVLVLAKLNTPKKIQLLVADDWKYELIKNIKKELETTRNAGEIIRKVMIKEYGKEIASLVPKLINDQSKMPKEVTSQKEELTALKNATEFLKEEFEVATIEVIKSESSQHEKSKQALPGKPAIIVE